MLAWRDLVLRAPRFSWPNGCQPRREPGWQKGVRVCWEDALGRFVYACPAAVPGVEPLLALRRGQGTRVAVARGRSRTRRDLQDRSGRVVATVEARLARLIEQGAREPLEALKLRVCPVGLSQVLAAFRRAKTNVEPVAVASVAVPQRSASDPA